MKIKVKPLEWVQSGGPWSFRAGWFGREYRVSQGLGDYDWKAVVESPRPLIIGMFPDIVSAKAAVQERHEASILSAIEVEE